MGGRTALEVGTTGRALTVTALSPAGAATRLEATATAGLLAATIGLSKALGPFAGVALRPGPVRRVLGAAAYAHGERVPAAVMAAAAVEVAASDGLRALPAVLFTGLPTAPQRCPVTVAWGSRDLTLYPWQQARVARALPGARQVRLAGLGHVPMSDDPEVVADVILRTTGAR